MPERYRKKPVVIEAWRMLPIYGEDVIKLALWCRGELIDSFTDGPSITIGTLEGDMKAVPGDWIIQGVKGEFYPCKDDIFKATYEPA